MATYIIEKTRPVWYKHPQFWMNKNGVEAMKHVWNEVWCADPSHNHTNVGVPDVSYLHITIENPGDLFSSLLIISSVWGSGVVGDWELFGVLKKHITF